MIQVLAAVNQYQYQYYIRFLGQCYYQPKLPLGAISAGALDLQPTARFEVLVLAYIFIPWMGLFLDSLCTSS